MPELPEVETVRRGLNQLVSGAVITSVDVFWNKMITPPFSSEKFKEVLVGEQIHTIERRGKYLIFLMDHWAMVSHLRMEGKYEVVSQEEPYKKHTHVVFHLSDRRDLRYLDVRKFGRFTLLPIDKRMDYEPIRKLGPEPIAKQFQVNNFHQKLAKTSRAIKPVILDQTIVAGVGNIYADESLFLAKVNPLKPANQLNEKETGELHAAIIEVIQKAVELGGTTVRSYVNSTGEKGSFQVKLNVYGKKNEPCPRCGTPIEKIKVAQRGTHFCPNCQRYSGEIIKVGPKK
ncbi:DNA-formamidopyrimidine glycosylase [Jeotgalibaca caeni]|uniref:DNA-formamidopyrimidine glycosylase n=1 Tax=Jeotgalibaca caeni TaxID=3028623 RepID=UPI00237D9A4F|nr:DNA-formamidopyrimidine glycosylase [Jeotgalibaca caeni]MDE1548653.1 DNA-formamidopyrimidine glycosylase [Jeotgalibaca caeni]